MNKRLLIISPYFPPSNAADMQRVRMSLPYFKQFGWDTEVVTVDSGFSDIVKDELLLQSLPNEVLIHKVKAFSKKWTSKFGLGSLALRSILFYRQKVNELLRTKKFDVIYFSTTAFPVCILGPYWKKKFNIPYVIDMQDPWHSDYYRDNPKHPRPPKYWLSYRLNKYLEPIAMRSISGLISVSKNYINDLKERYPEISSVPAQTIPFGAFAPDLEITQRNEQLFTSLLEARYTNIVYVGRGGHDMHRAVSMVFKALRRGLQNEPEIFDKLKMYFIGTSYAPNGRGLPTIRPLAEQFGVEKHVIEITDRISYYHTLITLQQADALFVPGSDDPQYTASKIYPYLLSRKPLMAVFNINSNVVEMIRQYTEEVILATFSTDADAGEAHLYKTLRNWGKKIFQPSIILDNFKELHAESLTAAQTELFNQAIYYFERENTNA